MTLTDRSSGQEREFQVKIKTHTNASSLSFLIIWCLGEKGTEKETRLWP